MASGNHFVLPVTRNIWDERRYVYVIYSCSSMFREYFTVNHEGIGAFERKLWPSARKCSKHAFT